MSETATQTHFSQIPARDSRDWEFVKSLLQDLQAEEDREELASLFGQWKLSIKAFRRVEERRMIREAPDALDLKFHKSGVCHLISFGTMLQIAAAEYQTDDLAKHGLHKDLLDALLKDLHNTFDEWHGQVPEQRVNELTEKIFNGTSGSGRENSRTQIRAEETPPSAERVR
jgi:hypothetical protein